MTLKINGARKYSTMKRSFFLTATIMALLLLISCYEPSPLYGKWADNIGNDITFISDGTFVAHIMDDETEKSELYQGTYTVIENTLVFSITGGASTNTEWDIRGAMLFCTFTDKNKVTKKLTLYHVSK
ncbi:MAG: hypothetical protein K2O09_05315 [Treponemataceae bacterium]|nr:hypothetical protein [Treponemataceae bacterium]